MNLLFLSPVQVCLCATLLSIFLNCVLSREPPHKAILRAIFSQPKTLFISSTPEEEQDAFNYLEFLVENAEHLMLHRQDSRAALRKFRLAGLLGHSGALTTIAVHLLAGDSKSPRDIASAVRHLRLAANAGQPDAHALLGSLHASGLTDRHGIFKSSAKSLLYWTFSAEARNAHASAALGFRYLLGIGVKKNCHIAAYHYRRAAKSVATDGRYWPSATNFVQGKPPLPSGLVETPPTRLDDKSINGNHIDTGEQDVVHFYRHSADRGNSVARTTLGALYYFGGHGIDPNEIQARHHLELAANLENGQAHTMLGHLDMRAQRNTSAFLHFMYGQSLHDHQSHYALGMTYCYGLLGKEIDYSKAHMHFQLVLDQNRSHAGAFFQLGMLYWYGKGVERNSGKAFELFRKAADAGNIQSKWNVGAMLTSRAENKKNVEESEKDCQKGVNYLKEVAEDGEWKTVLEMAMERIEQKDWYGALHRYLEAAHAGIELAQYNAAFLLEKLSSKEMKELRHWSRRRMLKEAHELYEYSALQGHTDSLVRCAKAIYVEMKDYIQAAAIFKKAATLGNAEGMVSLGLMYARGKGVVQNRLDAVQYLQKASSVDLDAVAPANVGLVGVHLYWILEDLWGKVEGFSLLMKFRRRQYITQFEKESESSKTMVRGSEQGVENDRESLNLKLGGDIAVVGFLLLALVAVLIVRTKRLARQTGTSPTNSGRARQDT